MARQEVMCGLDVGSAQITCVLGRRDVSKNTIEIISGAKVGCRGVNGGVVVNIPETVSGIKQVVEEAEEGTDIVVYNVYLGVRGAHIETLNNRGVLSISRTDKEITAEDVMSVIETARAIQLSPDREIIDIIAQEFSVDRQKGVPDPTGMEGNYLEVYVHIVTAATTHLKNISKAVSQAGFSIIEPIYNILGVGDIVVTDEEKELGCLLVDFGGQTTGLAVYSERSIRYSKELPLGSDLITRDISHALRTSIAQAREIKERYGVASPKMINKDEEIEFTGVDGRTIRKTNKKFLAEIIAPRVEEIFEKVNEELQNANLADVVVPGGVILTGGGALLGGIEKAVEQILGIGVRLGLPQGVKGPNDIISNPAFATAIGLLKYRPSIESVKTRGFIRRFKIPFWKKFRDMFL
ncbi:MAG: cell division protein FtsA [Elusimicrobiota bacterium]|nr:cell division protein FtsA [Elusimicrobiota bacterium]